MSETTTEPIEAQAAESSDEVTEATPPKRRSVWKTLVGIVAVLLVAVLAVGYMMPGGIRVARTIEIDAPPAEVFAVVSDLRTWDEWTAWNSRRDPSITREHSGETGAVGSEMTWTSDNLGDGRLRVTNVKPPERMMYQVWLDGDDGMDANPGQFYLTPINDGAATRVEWTFDTAASNPVGRIMLQVFKGMIEEDFATGLTGLKQHVESKEP